MKKEDKMGTRRDALRKMMQGAGFLGIGALTWGAYANEAKATEFILRPPGAIEEEDFLKACIKCGECVTACPYDTLKLASPGDKKPMGTPYFEPRKVACEMCTEIPCVPVCPSGALDVNLVSLLDEKTQERKLDINKAKMGAAIIDQKTCVAFWGVQCDLCYRACPLMDEAISIEYERNERTGKHAFLKPVVNVDACTGCGLCEAACITEESSIIILPLNLITGKNAGTYIKGWDPEDEKRLEETKEEKDKGNQKALDYLNGDWEDLLDE